MSAIPILYVEDSEDDVFFLQRAFKAAAVANPIQVAVDGQEAIDYLAGIEKFSDRRQYPLPCLVLLDLKLRGKMGLDVLQWIRERPAVRTLLVIILSSSSQKADVDRAYELGANAFLVKPSNIEILTDMAKAIKHFWLTHNYQPLGFGEPRPEADRIARFS